MVTIQTTRLRLSLESTEDVLARIEEMSPADRAEVSSGWVDRLRSSPPGPWTHGFSMTESATGTPVGSCGFKGPPDAKGVVEIAYAVDPAWRGRGYAKEAVSALIDFAREAGARTVRAHTLPEQGPSPRVLTACGFAFIGETVDPEDGVVWRWERSLEAR